MAFSRTGGRVQAPAFQPALFCRHLYFGVRGTCAFDPHQDKPQLGVSAPLYRQQRDALFCGAEHLPE